MWQCDDRGRCCDIVLCFRWHVTWPGDIRWRVTWPADIRSHPEGDKMNCLDQSEASIQVTWSVWTNQRPDDMWHQDDPCPDTADTVPVTSMGAQVMQGHLQLPPQSNDGCRFKIQIDFKHRENQKNFDAQFTKWTMSGELPIGLESH